MIRISYTATRSLTGMRTSGDPVTMSFSTTTLTPGREITRVQQKAIGGQRETLLHNALRTWQVTTEPFDGATLEQFTEFLCSVEGGEGFSFEAWRQETAPTFGADFVTPRFRMVEPAQVTLETESWSLQEIINSGTGGADDSYSISFAVKEIPA